MSKKLIIIGGVGLLLTFFVVEVLRHVPTTQFSSGSQRLVVFTSRAILPTTNGDRVDISYILTDSNGLTYECVGLTGANQEDLLLYSTINLEEPYYVEVGYGLDSRPIPLISVTKEP